MLFEYNLSAQQVSARRPTAEGGVCEANVLSEDFYNITSQVREAVTKSGVTSGIAVVFNPHTTAGITINENADPDVIPDQILGLNKAFPDRGEFRHAEGNSAAHLKASAMGASATIIIENGKLVLGTWQGIYFCEIDTTVSRCCTITSQAA